MGIQKSQKGRQSAAQQTGNMTRRKGGRSDRTHQGRQQFGGVAHRTDRDLDQLSNQAKRAISEKRPAPRKRR